MDATCFGLYVHLQGHCFEYYAETCKPFVSSPVYYLYASVFGPVSTGVCRAFGAMFGFRDLRLFVWSYCMRSWKTEKLLHAELILHIAHYIRNLVHVVSYIATSNAVSTAGTVGRHVKNCWHRAYRSVGYRNNFEVEKVGQLQNSVALWDALKLNYLHWQASLQ